MMMSMNDSCMVWEMQKYCYVGIMLLKAGEKCMFVVDAFVFVSIV